MMAKDLTSDVMSTSHHHRHFDEIDDSASSTSVDLDVHASESELEQFERQGFLVRPGLLSSLEIERLGTALAEVAAAYEGVMDYTAGIFDQNTVFGGWGPRWLMHRHETFLQLAFWEPVLSIVRAMLGPRVRVRHCQSRVSWPSAQAVVGETSNDSSWHHHMRHVPKPLPPFWSYPHRVDCLIYIDELNEQTGGLYVVPSTHELQHQPLDHATMTRITGGTGSHDINTNKSDEFCGSSDGGDGGDSLRPHLITGTAPGTCILMHRQLWHKAAANIHLNPKTSPSVTAAAAGTVNNGESMRRMIIVQFAPLEGRSSPMGRQTKPLASNPVSRLVAEAAKTGDTVTLELLGKSGYQ
jgi:hypothetical protein